MGKYDEVNSTLRMMGLKGPTKRKQAKIAHRKKFTPLDEEQVSEIESDLGVTSEESSSRRRRRRTAKVFESLLGSSAADRLGG